MTDMVEKVARAMWDKRRDRLEGTKWGGLPAWEVETDELRDEVRAEARAAIEAMRDPTPEMLAVGIGGAEGVKRRLWHLMIDAAVSNTRESGE